MGRTEWFGTLGTTVKNDGVGTRSVTVGGTGEEIVPSMHVYYPQEAALYLGEGVPLYLTWIVEGSDGKLYLVPCETTGWYRRSVYNGPSEGLKRVLPEDAQTIVQYVRGELAA